VEIEQSFMAQETNEGVAIWRPQNSRPVRWPRQQRWHGTLSGDDYGRWQTISGSRTRRSPRYKSSGSAELRDDGLDVWTWATQQW